MKVRELIKLLKLAPPDAQVAVRLHEPYDDDAEILTDSPTEVYMSATKDQVIICAVDPDVFEENEHFPE